MDMGNDILFRLVDLVKESAVGKVRRLRSLPAAENVVHAHQLELRKKVRIFG